MGGAQDCMYVSIPFVALPCYLGTQLTTPKFGSGMYNIELIYIKEEGGGGGLVHVR